jgi:hypothetical protein
MHDTDTLVVACKCIVVQHDNDTLSLGAMRKIFRNDRTGTLTSLYLERRSFFSYSSAHTNRKMKGKIS